MKLVLVLMCVAILAVAVPSSARPVEKDVDIEGRPGMNILA